MTGKEYTQHPSRLISVPYQSTTTPDWAKFVMNHYWKAPHREEPVNNLVLDVMRRS